MILAAGLGTRLKPLTDSMPKALVPVSGQPLLYHLIMRLRNAGYTRLVVNVHHFGQQIIDYLAANGNFGLDISISDERSELLDTGGALKQGLPMFSAESPVLVHNVDILSNVDLALFYEQAAAAAADALLLVGHRHTSRHLLFDEHRQLCGWSNDDKGLLRLASPDLDASRLQRLAFSGIHVVRPQVAALMQSMPSRFGIFDFYMRYCHQLSIQGHVKSDLRMLDVGKLDTLAEAEAFLADSI